MNTRLLSALALAMCFATPTLSSAQSVSAPAATADETATNQTLSPAIELPMNLIMQVREGAEVRVASGLVGRDEALVSIPFRYRRTAELTADLVAPGGWRGSPMVMLKAGAKGYWAGRFRSQIISTTTYGGVPVRSSPGAVSQTEIWCFFGVDDRNRDASACVQQIEDGTTKLVTTGSQPYLLQSFSSSPYSAEVSQFQFVEKPLELFPDLRMEYRFREWDNRDLDVHLVVRDTLITNLPSIREADGTALVTTPAGNLRLRQSGNDRRTATVTLEKAIAPAPKPEPSQEAREADMKARLLAFADVIENRAKVLDNERPLRAHVVSLAPVDGEPRIVQRGEVVARQTVRPMRAYTQDTRPLGRTNGRFGNTGSTLFEAIWDGGPPALCWRNPQQLEAQNRGSFGTVDSFCLQDMDGDGRYEVLWKRPRFSPGSRYVLVGWDSRTVLSGGDEPPITVRPADPATLLPETIEITYVGVSDEGMNQAGVVKPEAIEFNWKFASFPQSASSSPPFKSLSVKLDADGNGKISDNGRDTIRVAGVAGNSQARVQFLGMFLLGDQLLTNPAAGAAQLRDLAKSIRESETVTGRKATEASQTLTPTTR